MAASSDIWLADSTRPELKKFLDFRRFYMLTYNYIPWNGRDPILSDKRVRRALAMCLDLESMTQPGIIKGLVHRGGLNAEILTDGELRPGDDVMEL